MTDREHAYEVQVEWSGNLGTGTSAYGAYSRAHEISVTGKPPIAASADPAFRGDTARHNPEELLVAALSGCHMLSYLYLCTQARIVVLAYRDTATGVMTIEASGAGRFRQVTLHPMVRLAAGADVQRATALHERAHALCFIAQSVNFPVECQPKFLDT
ncbi:MAG: OsmC family protein [Steroidobacteraceae bacterium]